MQLQTVRGTDMLMYNSLIADGVSLKTVKNIAAVLHEANRIGKY